ncbi:MAG: LysM peptidoglycan-binding domain-containing protein, partial [Verrucomicrobiota bacterium]
SLGSIARKFGLERSALLEANRLSEGQPIYIGETLLIPGAGPEPETSESETTKSAASTAPAPANEKSVVLGETGAGAKSHTVAKGDTLTSISKTHGTDVPSLMRANGLKNDVISLGQNLRIPSPGMTEASSGSTAAAEYEYDNELLKNDETYGYYTVRKGDNLYALARDFFTNMPELQRLNRLGASTLIFPGDELIVPTSKYNAHHGGGVAQR